MPYNSICIPAGSVLHGQSVDWAAPVGSPAVCTQVESVITQPFLTVRAQTASPTEWARKAFPPPLKSSMLKASVGILAHGGEGSGGESREEEKRRGERDRDYQSQTPNYCLLVPPLKLLFGKQRNKC